MITPPPKFITVEGVRFAYFEVNPDGEKTIFFIHGNSSSSHIWRAQLESDLFSGYRLIAFDLPAHGQSPCFHDYSLPVLGRIVSAVINVLAAGHDYIVAGLSLGTNVLAEALGHSLKPKGIIAIGSCALGGQYTMDVVFITGVDLQVVVTDQVSGEELRQYWIQAGLCMHDEGDEKYRSFAKDYFAVTDNFRSKIAATIMAGYTGDEVALFRQSETPMLVMFGAEEKVCNIDYLDNAGLSLWRNKVFKIPGAGHFLNIDLPESSNELMADFAKGIFSK